MLRHACGFALAAKGHDTRALQAYLGHKNIQHTVRCTELSPTRFKSFWRVCPAADQPDRDIAQELTDRGIRTPRGGDTWNEVTVVRVMKRVGIAVPNRR